MKALLIALLHTIPIFGSMLFSKSRGAVVLAIALMVVVAVATGSSQYLALDLLVIAAAGFICLKS